MSFEARTKWTDFDKWWGRLKRLASDEGVRLFGIQDEYRDFFEDGDTPADTLVSIVESRDSAV